MPPDRFGSLGGALSQAWRERRDVSKETIDRLRSATVRWPSKKIRDRIHIVAATLYARRRARANVSCSSGCRRRATP